MPTAAKTRMPGSVVATPNGVAASSRLRSLLLLEGADLSELPTTFLRWLSTGLAFFRPWSASFFDVEGFCSSFAVFLNPAFEGERVDPKCSDDFALLGVAVDIKLTDDHLKRGCIVHVMNEYWHHPMQVADLTVFPKIAKVFGDQVSAFLEAGPL